MSVESIAVQTSSRSIFVAAGRRLFERHGPESETPRQFLLPVTASVLCWLDKRFGMLDLPGEPRGRFGEELQLLSAIGRFCLVGYFVLPPTLFLDAFPVAGRFLGYTKDVFFERMK